MICPETLLEDLVRVDSPTGCEDAAVGLLVARMHAAGFDAFIDDAGNAVGFIGERSAEPDLMLLGHIDTVPGMIPVRREGDLLWGRGAVDAKGPLACFVTAARRAASRIVGAGGSVAVVGAVGEEGSSRGARHVRDRYRPACTIIGEPSGWERVTIGYKGSAAFTHTVRREAAHASAGEESACEAALAYWTRVNEWVEMRNRGVERAFERISASLRGMSSRSDGLTDTAELRFSLRLPLRIECDALEDSLAALPGGEALTMIDALPAWRAPKNTPLVRAFLAAIRAAGGDPSFTVKTGTSDMNVVAPAWGTPILAYGPGDSALDHTPHEHIRLSELNRAASILEAVIVGMVEQRARDLDEGEAGPQMSCVPPQELSGVPVGALNLAPSPVSIE